MVDSPSSASSFGTPSPKLEIANGQLRLANGETYELKTVRIAGKTYDPSNLTGDELQEVLQKVVNVLAKGPLAADSIPTPTTITLHSDNVQLDDMHHMYEDVAKSSFEQLATAFQGRTDGVPVQTQAPTPANATARPTTKTTPPKRFFQAATPGDITDHSFRGADDLDTLSAKFPGGAVSVQSGVLATPTKRGKNTTYRLQSGRGPEIELREYGKGSGITNRSSIGDADFVVNAANPDMKDGDGIAGAFFKAAPGLKAMEAPVKAAIKAADGIADKDRPKGSIYTHYARPGWTVTSPAYGLPMKSGGQIIHAVAPNCQGGSLEMTHLTEEQRCAALYSVYRNIFAEAEATGGVVVIPAIGTGIYKFDKTKAAQIAVLALQDHTTANPASNITKVRFLMKDDDLTAYKQALASAC